MHVKITVSESKGVRCCTSCLTSLLEENNAGYRLFSTSRAMANNDPNKSEAMATTITENLAALGCFDPNSFETLTLN